MPSLGVRLSRARVPRLDPRAGVGLLTVGLIVAAGFACSRVVPSVGPALWAVAFGMLLAPLARSRPANSAGVRVAATHLLRSGVALLGLSISLGELAEVGLSGIAAAMATVVSTMALTVWLGRRLGVDGGLAILIAAGTAICGASAIIAVNVATRARDEHIGYAVATVTMFGTAAMLLLPWLSGLIGLSEHEAGMWAGASVHEVAQAAAAGAVISGSALKVATLVKLSRVVMLAAVVAAVSARSGDGTSAKPRIPGFVIGFVALVIVRSVVPLPGEVLQAAALTSSVLLAAGLAALGLGMRVSALRGAGSRPLLLGLAASGVAAISALSVLVVLS